MANGERISRSLEVSTSMFMAEKAACERLADLPVCADNLVSKACNWVETDDHTMSSLLNGFKSLLWYPVMIVQSFSSETPDISIRSNHPVN